MISAWLSKKIGNDFELDIALSVEEGNFVALTGESGSGKTTLLRILAGLEKANGKIKVGSQIWQSERFFLPPQKRDVGFVFQNYALFENMTVEENLLFVQKDKELAEHLLETVQMQQYKKKYAVQLSGGQKQRISLARALMRRPKLLLLDEPFSALDTTMRSKLQHDILRLHKEFGTTTIMVSHNPSEIYRLASKVFVMKKGRIVQEGTPKEVFLKTQGSQKFSFEGEILDIYKADVIYVVVVAVAGQIAEVVVSSQEAQKLFIGAKINVGVKAFSPTIFYSNHLNQN